MKVLINNCYGGFTYSPNFILEYHKRKGIKLYAFKVDYAPGFVRRLIPIAPENVKPRAYIELSPNEDGSEGETLPMHRDDPDVISLFEELGSDLCSGDCAQLGITNVPDGAEYSIGEYDGDEWVSDTWVTVSKEELLNGLSKEKLALAEQCRSIKLKREQ